MATTTASAVPFIVPPTITPVRECARCRGPATTRCARCKSFRYCSAKCQIIHWRLGHKEECQPPDYVDSYSRNASFEEAGFRRDFGHGHDAECPGYSSEWHMHEKTQFNVELHAVNPGATFANTSPCSGRHDSREVPKLERRISERKTSHKTTKETPYIGNRATDANLKEANARQRVFNIFLIDFLGSILSSLMHHKILENQWYKFCCVQPRVNRPTTPEISYPEMHDMNRSGRRYESQSTHGIRSQNGDSLVCKRRYK